MHLKKAGVPGTTMHPAKYVFLEPARLWVVHPDDDDMQLIGYGIGEIIEVMEPAVQYLVAIHDEKEFLELADGSIAYKHGNDWPTVGRA